VQIGLAASLLLPPRATTRNAENHERASFFSAAINTSTRDLKSFDFLSSSRTTFRDAFFKLPHGWRVGVCHRQILKSKAWADTERIVVGGGFRQSRVGEIAIARTDIILKAEGFKIDLVPIRFHPDDAGLIGCLHLAPSWIFEGYDSILAVDIGGTNIRCGVVETRWKKASDLSKATVWKSELWRHADDEPTREGAVKRLVKMLKGLLTEAETEGLKLAPFIGISCPGVINADGTIEKGAQNLPGNWESSKFNLPASLVEAIPEISGHDTAVVMHNDGVVQGLSEVPFMQDVDSWGVLTIGTGLGNARFTNRKPEKKAKTKDKDAQKEEKEEKKSKKSS
jgi:hypothetical protein